MCQHFIKILYIWTKNNLQQRVTESEEQIVIVEWYLHTCHYNKYTNYYFHHIGILVQSFKFSEYWCKGFELGCIWSNTSKQHQARLRCWNFKVFTTNPCSWFSQISSLSCSAFVWLFPTVCFQIILQMAYVRGCRITLTGCIFSWLSEDPVKASPSCSA